MQNTHRKKTCSSVSITRIFVPLVSFFLPFLLFLYIPLGCIRFPKDPSFCSIVYISPIDLFDVKNLYRCSTISWRMRYDIWSRYTAFGTLRNYILAMRTNLSRKSKQKLFLIVFLNWFRPCWRVQHSTWFLAWLYISIIAWLFAQGGGGVPSLCTAREIITGFTWHGINE
jgi:hypothetical protein